jgi:MoxR-like ATPase
MSEPDPVAPGFEGTDRYIAAEDLRTAVDVAVALERPLLIRGEPGTGKTLLADAVSEALGLELLVWSVKSTTRAQDGLYTYDTVQRLTTASSARATRATSRATSGWDRWARPSPASAAWCW